MDEYDWGWGDIGQTEEDWGWGDISNVSISELKEYTDYTGYDWGFGDVSTKKISGEATSKLGALKNEAISLGNIKAAKIIDTIIVKGLGYVKLAVDAGILKSKNLPTSILEFDTSKVDDNGNLLEQPKTTTTTKRSAETNILGIPLTYVVVGLVGFALYMLFKEPNPNKQKSR